MKVEIRLTSFLPRKLSISMVMADVTALAIVQNMASTPSWMEIPEILSLSKSFKYRK